MDDLAKKLNIKNVEEWRTVATNTLKQHGAFQLLRQHNGSIDELLATIYPQYPM